MRTSLAEIILLYLWALSQKCTGDQHKRSWYGHLEVDTSSMVYFMAAKSITLLVKGFSHSTTWYKKENFTPKHPLVLPKSLEGSLSSVPDSCPPTLLKDIMERRKNSGPGFHHGLFGPFPKTLADSMNQISAEKILKLSFPDGLPLDLTNTSMIVFPVRIDDQGTSERARNTQESEERVRRFLSDSERPWSPESRSDTQSEASKTDRINDILQGFESNFTSEEPDKESS